MPDQTISTRLMDQVLSLNNWQMAAELNSALQDSKLQFPPLPDPVPPGLVVPVDVQALYVPKPQEIPVPAHEGFVHLPPGLNGQSAAEPFSAQQPRPAGIHLHWALPDGLMGGHLSEDNDDLSMPHLPDRWLVVRMTGPENSHRLDLRGWVICSDTRRVYPMEDWPNGTPSEGMGELPPSEGLTAISGGGPNWTASYDAALNCFAFHDDLSGLNTDAVQTGLASYVVIGWWSDPAHDPLAGRYNRLTVAYTLNQLGWSASPAPWASPGPYSLPPPPDGLEHSLPDSEVVPGTQVVQIRAELALTTSQMALSAGYQAFDTANSCVAEQNYTYTCLMHGVVQGVPLRGRVLKDQRENVTAPGLTLAPTIESAMACFAVPAIGMRPDRDRRHIERLVTAVANGLLLELDQLDGLVKIDEAEHADGFQALTGPDTYTDTITAQCDTPMTLGRKLRSEIAAEASTPPLAAEAMWVGYARGRDDATVQDMRQHLIDTLSLQTAENQASGRAGNVRRITRPGPRYHYPVTPVIGLRNYGRSPRFREDGRFTDDRTLACRWTHEIATTIGDEGYRASDYVPSLGNTSLPPHAQRLVLGSYLLDPYMFTWASSAIVDVVETGQVTAVQNRLRGELALRYSPDGIYDGSTSITPRTAQRDSVTLSALNAELFEHSLVEGREASPVSITNWAQPWSPIWLEYELALEPGDGLTGWELLRIDYDGDYEEGEDPSAALGGPVLLRGRATLTTGLARSYQTMVQSYLAEEQQRDADDAGEISTATEEELADLSQFLENADLGLATLDALADGWLGLKHGPDGQVTPIPEAAAADLHAAGLPRLIASGRVRLTRARVVDSFGRYLNLPVDQAMIPAALSEKTEDGTETMKLPPRLALPARLMLRLTDPATGEEAGLNMETPSQAGNPVAGFLLPDFIDEAIEFFDRDGAPLGQVMHDAATGGVVWEGAVGREGPASAVPGAGLSASAAPCGALAQGMIDADIAARANPETATGESPLSAFLRAVDTGMWSVDEGLSVSSASVAGLMGRPVAVVNTRLWLDIPEELSSTGLFGDEADEIRDYLIANGVHQMIKSQGFPVHLGEHVKGHDGLYGYYVNGDFTRLHLIEKRLRKSTSWQNVYRLALGHGGTAPSSTGLPQPKPLDCPYIDAGGEVELHSGQVITLTLLMHPFARVHATSGILPRKSLELLRDWTAPGLRRIAPSARIGPVLIDPDKVRLPRIAAFGTDQSWTRRDSPVTWRDDPILSATQAALLPDGMVRIEEGYIRIAPKTQDDTS